MKRDENGKDTLRVGVKAGEDIRAISRRIMSFRSPILHLFETELCTRICLPVILRGVDASSPKTANLNQRYSVLKSTSCSIPFSSLMAIFSHRSHPIKQIRASSFFTRRGGGIYFFWILTKYRNKVWLFQDALTEPGDPTGRSTRIENIDFSQSPSSFKSN